MSSETDAKFMKRALALAARARGRTAPNPPVGAVVVKNGRIVGEGFHPAAGAPHAEVFALRQAGKAARKATIYVTLEPCAHTGRTPPCTLAIEQAGIARVVYAVSDPNPVAAGGAKHLQDAGISVTGGVLEAQARELLAPFLSAVLRARPYVELKMAGTLDGRTADRHGKSRYITGEASLRRVHRMRNVADAVLVGGNTLELDDPLLTCRGVPGGRDPIRVVVDPRLRHARPGMRLFSGGSSPVWVCVDAALDAASFLPFSGIERLEFLRIPCDASGRMAPQDILSALLERDVHHVLCEGGARTAGIFLESGVVDRIHFVYAPRLLLDASAVPLVVSAEARGIDAQIPLSGLRVRRSGEDVWVQADVLLPPRGSDTCSRD